MLESMDATEAAAWRRLIALQKPVGVPGHPLTKNVLSARGVSPDRGPRETHAPGAD